MISRRSSDFHSDLQRFTAPVNPPRGVRKLLKVMAEPGLTFCWLMRIQMRLERKKHIGLARIVHLVNLRVTGGEFGHGCQVGPGFVAKHPLGVVIGGGTHIGANCTVLHNVTFGELRPGESAAAGRYPTIGDDVVVGDGATVLGSVCIGAGATIGAGAVVLRDVMPGVTVVGVPAAPVRSSGVRAD